MTISSDELNYLIWRYLQEQGLEVSLFALKDETNIDQYDDQYNKRIPLGCLINLIQKGILYCEEDELVDKEGNIGSLTKKFNLFDALEKDKLTNPTTTINKLVVEEDKKEEFREPSPTLSETFTTVLNKSFVFSKSQTNDWNPRSSAVLSWGERNSSSIIAVLDDSGDELKTLSSLKLDHPSLSFASATSDITNVAWSTNGDMLLTASETGELRLWTTDGKLKNVMMLHNLPIITIKWFQDWILTKDSKKTIIWDSKTGLALQHLEETQGGIDACFIDETKILFPSSDYSVIIYDLINSVPLSKLNGHSDNISTINYSQSHKMMLTVSDDLSIRIWKGESINPTQILMGHSQLITYCSWLQCENFIVSGIEMMLLSTSLDGSIRIWNIYTGDLFFIATNSEGCAILQASISPDLKWLATGDVDGIITIWDISIESLNKNYEKRMNVATIKNKSQYQPDKTVDDNYISCISWSQDSQKIAVSYSEIDSVILCV